MNLEDLLITLRLMPRDHPAVTIGFFAAFGLCAGSFANVVIYRLPRRCLSVSKGRSFCPSCQAPLNWFDNVPVFAWALWLRGKCRHCKAPISARYPLVEVVTGLLFGLVAWRILVVGDPETVSLSGISVWQPWWLALMWCAAIVALLSASVIDIQMHIIPEAINFGGIATVLAVAPFLPVIHLWGVPEALVLDPYLGPGPSSPLWLRSLATSAIVMLVASSVLWLIGALGSRIFRKEAAKTGGAMGLGDVFYVALLAGLLGWPKMLLAFIIATLVAAIIGLPSVIQKWRGRDVNTVIPFGPYLSLGAAVAILFSVPLFGLVEAYVGFIRGGIAP